MPVTNREAYDLKKEGQAVIIVCSECEERKWTSHAVYDEGNDEWTCSDCHSTPGGD